MAGAAVGAVYLIAAENISVIAAVCTAVMFIAAIGILVSIAVKINSESEYTEHLEDYFNDYACIRFDKKRKIAFLSENVVSMTGIEAASHILEENEYEKYMEQVLACPYDQEESIYMSNIPEKWVQLVNFDSSVYEYTLLHDVSKYVMNKNLVRSLRYYDSATGILCRDAFISQVRASSEANKETIGLIHFVISGIEKVTSFFGSSAADEIIVRVASFIKKYENPHNIFTGRTATNEFTVLMTETYDDGCRKLATKIYGGLQELLKDMQDKEKNNVRIYCGYALFHGNDNTVNNMMAASDFAAFDAESSGSSVPVLFNPAVYSKRAQEFRKIQVFNTLIAENRVEYHFQPIVNAHTGAIFGYEALMRPQEIDGIKLSPLEMLSIAEQQDMLYEIEHITFFNTLKLLSENQDFFSSRKLFINCIPNSVLSDADFNKLSEMYGELFDKVVVEITEGSPVLDDAVKSINNRFRNHKAQVALDDYGTGYSNDSTLLSVKPDYIKIDRSIMMNIDKDPQKQHLVANMVNFASQHGITTLGEGIETLEELETAISLGIDLIQGFVACKATAILMLDIPIDVKNEIISYNLKYAGHVNKTYEVKSAEPVDIVNLALKGYTKMIVKTDKAVINGDPNIDVSMCISLENEGETYLKLNNLNLFATDSPAISICKGSDVNMEISGRNTLTHNGIRVPANSKLYICGNGSLHINSTQNNSGAIGGSYIQDYGQIIIDMDGSLDISSKGDNIIGIGGGIGSFDSLINLISGSIKFDLKGKDVVAVGSFVDETVININPIDIDISIGAQNAVGIGSKGGHVTVDAAANITTNISGDCCCCVGTLEKGSGNVRINGGSNHIVVKGKNIVGIGAVNGNMEVILNAGYTDILCEGDNATCAGDAFGSGSVRLCGAAVKAIAKASKENPVGVNNGKVYMTGGSVETSDIEPLKCYAPDGTPLKQVKVDGRNTFKDTIKGDESIYSYLALPIEMDTMNVYLPEYYVYNK